MTGRGDRPVRVIGCAICAVVLVVALRSIILDAKSANDVTAAERLEADEPVPADFVAGLADHVFRSGLISSCRPDIVEAAATLVLSNLDAAPEEGPEEGKTEMDASLNEADHRLKVLLACSPTDGNLWARLAMVEALLDAPGKRVGRMLQMSAELSPFEPGALHARLAFWTAWPRNRSQEARSALEQDVATLAGWVEPADSATFLNPLSRRDPALVREQLAHQTPERLSSLRQAGLQQASGS